MIRVNIKPLSVNKAFQGRRFKTPEYQKYEKECLLLLPNKRIELSTKTKYKIHFKFGFSSEASDWDNCIKTTQDCIAKKYKFNDKLIRIGLVETEQVAKGKEYFEFEITEI